MAEYINKIINLFTSSNYNNSIDDSVYEWLVEPENMKEKESALRDIWNNTSAEIDATLLLSFCNTYNKIGKKEENKYNCISNFKKYIAAAVVVLIITFSLGLYMVVEPSGAKISMVNTYTKTGEINTIVLSDGTKVKTNSETLLIYPKQFDRDNRTVFMIGEACFNVAKDTNRPFTVNSTDLTITALGTTFNVSAHLNNDEIITTLINGKLKVVCNKTDQTHIITPGQQIVYNKNTSNSKMITDVNIDNITAWQRGVFIFQNESFGTIVSVLEKQYDINFQYNSNDLFNQDKYNFNFHKDASFDYIMGIMQQVIGGFNYKVVDNICYVKSTKNL